MIKNNLLGNYYPFFLDNKFGISDVHYLYQIISPTYNKKTNVPYFSLTKVSEKSNYYTQSLPLDRDDDVLTVCRSSMESVRKGEKQDKNFDKVEFICENFYKGQKINIINNNDRFPYIELGEENTDLQKNLIVGIRNLLRWKNYKLFPGKRLDILITRDEFVVVDIKSDDNYVWLEPFALYKNKDVMLSNPLDLIIVDFNIEFFRNKYRWNKGEFKSNDLFKLINKIEYESFNYRSYFKK